MFQRFLRAIPAPGGPPSGAPPGSTDGETAAVRAIVARLEALPPERARFLAGFAYVMSRAAQADLEISDAETGLMESALVEQGGLDRAQAVLVVEMAKLETRRNGATADYLVTREFARLATLEEKLAVLRCCFVVSAADRSISAEEASVVNEIARELDVDPHLVNGVREEFVEQISAIQALRRMEAEPPAEGTPG
jgi:tellurite resistance protein